MELKIRIILITGADCDNESDPADVSYNTHALLSRSTGRLLVLLVLLVLRLTLVRIILLIEVLLCILSRIKRCSTYIADGCFVGKLRSTFRTSLHKYLSLIISVLCDPALPTEYAFHKYIPGPVTKSFLV